jgi:hypothetical protein
LLRNDGNKHRQNRGVEVDGGDEVPVADADSRQFTSVNATLDGSNMQTGVSCGLAECKTDRRGCGHS